MFTIKPTPLEKIYKVGAVLAKIARKQLFRYSWWAAICQLSFLVTFLYLLCHPPSVGLWLANGYGRADLPVIALRK
jgi:hypothetical protein